MRDQPPPADNPQPIFNAPPATLILCLVLIGICAVVRFAPIDLQFWILENFSLTPEHVFAQFRPDGIEIDPWVLVTFVTHIFLHYDWMHVLVNAGMTLAFGSLVERFIGSANFLLLFVASGIGGAMAQLISTGAEVGILLGASGGGYGLIGAAVPLLFATPVGLRMRRALIFIAVIMGVNVIFGIFGSGLIADGAEIAWQDHIGGFFTGLILLPILRRFA